MVQYYWYYLRAELALERTQPLVFVLPHVIVQVAFGHKALFADLTDKGLQTLVNNPKQKICYTKFKK